MAVCPRPTRRSTESSGQASVYLILLLAIVLLSVMAFSVDLTNLWFHRQQAQTAADAACQAGALDMLAVANGKTPPAMNFTANVGDGGSDCVQRPNATICLYARFNGFDGSSGITANAPSKSVSWTFPGSVAGVTAPSVSVAPYLKVVAVENVKTWFMGLAGTRYVRTAAACTCGLSGGPPSGAPIVVLNPTIQGALNLSGGAVIRITGGPQTSIQINSTNTDNLQCGPTSTSSRCYSAITCTGSGQIDTTGAGPNGTGGDVNVSGGPSFNPYCGSNRVQTIPRSGTFTGHWNGGTAAVSDPFAWVPAPNRLANYNASQSTKPLWVPYNTDGCPNRNYKLYLVDSVDPRDASSPIKSAGSYAACLEFFPGFYPNGIDLTAAEFRTRGVPPSYNIAIFAPGVYYLNGNFVVTQGGTVRNAWPGLASPSSTSPNQTDGVMFYFVKGGPQFEGNTDANDSSIDPVPRSFLSCATPTTGVTGSLNGAVLIAQCTSKGSYYQAGGTSNSDSLSSTGSRSILMFGDHDNTIPANNPTTFGASGSLTFVGSLYFSNSKDNYGDVLTMNGAAGPNTLVVGEIIADQLQLSGSGSITMNILPGSTVSSTLQFGTFQ